MRVLVVEDSGRWPRCWSRACAIRAWQWTRPTTGSKRPRSSTSMLTTWSCWTATCPASTATPLCQMITDRDQRAMVLMLTAADAPGDRVTGLALGADDYLGKPFHFPELVLRIRALARRKPSARARVLRAAGIELDPLRRTVTRDGRPADLSVKEFGVLEALLLATPAFCAPRICLSRSGTSKPTRSPTPSPSRSAGCAESSATRPSSRPRRASATGFAISRLPIDRVRA